MRQHKKGNVVVFIYELDSNRNYRIDFSTGNFKTEDVIFRPLIETYRTIQIIQPESTYIKTSLDLDIEKVKYFTFTEFKKRSFFQNACSEIITDLIIPPNDLNFLYPYSYGHYIYLVKRNEFLDVESCLSTWINNCFPNRFRDIDNLYAGQVSDRFNFFDNENFILTTNYDHNTDIGIVLKSNKAQETVEWLKKQTEILGIFDFELETFDNCHRTRVIN